MSTGETATDSRHTILNPSVPYMGGTRMEISCVWAEDNGLTNVFEGIHFCPFDGWVIEPRGEADVTDNPGDPLAALQAEMERAREALDEVAVRYARARAVRAAELLREVVPGAAVIVANLRPDYQPSIYRVFHKDGSEIPELVWVDQASDVEGELGMALDHCEPADAGWEHDDPWYRLTLPSLGDQDRSE